MTTNAGRLTEPHSVWAEGPPCDEQCPGRWSQYHDGYAWGYEKAEAEVRARLAAEVKALPMTFGLHTCWDNHEGGVDAEGNPTLHADGSTCGDRVVGESVDRAAVLALIQPKGAPVAAGAFKAFDRAWHPKETCPYPDAHTMTDPYVHAEGAKA